MQLDFGFSDSPKHIELVDATKEILIMITRIRKSDPYRFNYRQEKWIDNIRDYVIKHNAATEKQLEVLKDIYKQVS